MGTIEEMFEGKPSALPAPVARGRALYQQEDGSAAVVRHVGGYGPFVEFCAGQGVRAEIGPGSRAAHLVPAHVRLAD